MVVITTKYLESTFLRILQYLFFYKEKTMLYKNYISDFINPASQGEKKNHTQVQFCINKFNSISDRFQ